jgi:Leucine-rich repeat (LRR) protein
MQRVHPALCWEWSLAGLRAGLSTAALSHAVTVSALRLRDLRLSWGGICAGALLPALADCMSLTRLDLADASLNDSHGDALGGVLRGASGLTHLDLSANELSDIRSFPLEACVHLRWLGLGLNTHLTAMPPGLSALTALTLLNIGGNSLAAVPAATRKLRNLIQLDLGSNRIAAIPL